MRHRIGISSALVLSSMVVLLLIGLSLTYMSIGSLDSKISSIQSRLSSSSYSSTTVTTQTQYNEIKPTIRHITLVAMPAKIEIANGAYYNAWTFNGTVPGPTIFVNQGDTIFFKLINNFTDMSHSIDFHAAEIDWSTAYATVGPGQTKTFNFTVNYPGVFMYHCGTPPVLEHIANGMYGAIVVKPPNLPQAPGGEYVIVQSEFYLNSKPDSNGAYSGNYTKMLNGEPDYVVFNGQAFKYQKNPLTVKPDELVRLYILNVGPNHWSAFHVIGAIMDTVYIDGNPSNVMHGLQTLNLPPSGGAIVQMYFRDPGGKNPFVTHDFADASKGAVGLFVVQNYVSTSQTTTSSSASKSVSTVKVDIDKGAASNTQSAGYTPSIITVVIGVNNTVVWVNDDNAPHTVTSTNGAFNSGNMNPGDTFSFTFTTPGVYQYICTYHPWMKGTVIVKQA